MKIDKRKIYRSVMILTGFTGSTSIFLGMCWLFADWVLGLYPLSVGSFLLFIGVPLMIITFYLDYLYYYK